MSCKFCESITNSDKEINWHVRSTMADDNICEFVNGNNCGCCDDCYIGFKLYGYTHKNNTYVGVEYEQRLKSEDGTEVIINPFSETIQFNFCPICGEQISKDIKQFGSYYDNQININYI